MKNGSKIIDLSNYQHAILKNLHCLQKKPEFRYPFELAEMIVLAEKFSFF